MNPRFIPLFSSTATLSAMLLASTISVAHAHGAWLAERAGETAIILGEGSHDDAYDADKVTVVSGITAAGNAVDVQTHAHDNNVTLSLPESAAVVAFVMDNGYWTKKADGEWVNQPKNEVENADSAGHYLKNAVSFVGDADGVKPAHFPDVNLLILPDENPIDKHAGEELGVTVFFDGQPVAGVELIADFVNDMETVVATTNADGQASIPVRNNGLNVIAGSYTVALKDDPKADKNGYMATLSFSNLHDHH